MPTEREIRRAIHALPSCSRSPHWILVIAALLPSIAACGGALGTAGTAARGKELAAELGCASCHSVTGGPSVGPTWRGLYGSQVALANGRSLTADDVYLAGRLADPGAVTVEGYQSGTMTAALQPHRAALGKPENVVAIVEYIKTLK